MKRSEINVPVACGMDWDAMQKSGGDPKRFCGDCQKHVHNLSSMTKAEAADLLASESTEGLCVRYLYDEQGNVVFDAKKEIVATGALTRFARAKRYVAAAVTLALPMSLNACMGAYQPPPPRPPVPATEPAAPVAPTAAPAPTPEPTAPAPPSAPIAK